MKYSAIIFFLVFPLLLLSKDVDPIYLTLNGDITDPNQEISGLAWHNDDLVLLPQYPREVLYYIPKNEILDLIDSKRSTLTPKTINWNAKGLEKKVKGFEGFESIAFEGDDVYLTIEAEKRKSNCGYVVKGTIKDNSIELDSNTLKKIKTPVTLRNMTYETILLTKKNVITIYEVNARNVNKKPQYYKFNKSLTKAETQTFPYIDYRITDATALDDENKFWVINYFWPGDYNLLKPNLDYLVTNNKDIKPIERLLEFQLNNDTIIRTNKPALNIKLSEFSDSRNWEGMVRLNEIGFLIATDKFPGTILAFLPFSE